MSAAEIISEIKKLPRAEREYIVSFVRGNQAELLEPAPDAGAPVAFDEAAKSVFAKHRELLHKLAQ